MTERVYLKVPANWAEMTDADKARWSADVLERLQTPPDQEPPETENQR
jgi:hypothetical protein